MRYNFTAYMHRNAMAIRANLQTDKRQFVLKTACEGLNKFGDYEKHFAITEWSKEFKLSEKILNSYLNNEEISFSNTELLREFLLTFTIIENEISGQLHIEKEGTFYTLDELTILAEDENLKTWNMNKLLNSNNKNITVVKVENPLETMFLELADNYRGEPLIHQLANCITAFDFGDHSNGHYQKRLEKYFHKWLCKAAGQALHIGANDAMFLLLDPFGGSGKSFLIQWLFSLKNLNNYYIRISENESFIDMKGISRSMFAIDWDELPISKKRYPMFKSIISSNLGQVYSKYTKSYELYNRQVNFIGSSNKVNRERQSGFLIDEDAALMRRIIPIEIDGQIDYKKYLKDIDLKQLWGQAACDIIKANESNNKDILTWENDWDELRRSNERYINKKTHDNNIIFSLFRPGDKTNGHIMSAMEILKELNARGIKLYMNEMEIGRFMSRYGYEKVRNGRQRGYYIKN